MSAGEGSHEVMHGADDPRSATVRYVSGEVPGIGGRLKARPEDFLVDELPLYDPCGQGEHIYLYIEKIGMSTFDVVQSLAAHFKVHKRAIGYAGLKDRQAITRQVFSVHVPGKKIEQFPSLDSPRMKVMWSDYHANKLRPGHLKGNRFSLRVRDVRMSDVVRVKRVLQILARVGVPNRFGAQRFGAAKNNHLVGRELIRGDYEAALRALLMPVADVGSLRSQEESRSLFAEGKYGEALAVMPRNNHTERNVLKALSKGMSARRAFETVDQSAVRFFVSAAQSAVFNHVLDARLDEGLLGGVRVGDIAMTETRGIFRIDEAAAADPETARRLGAFELSPTGPMWGTSMLRAEGTTAEIERAALERFGLRESDLERFESAHGDWIEGARRPLRIAVTNVEYEGGIDEHGEYVRVAFDLPRGSFATVVMEEIIKSGTLGAVDESEVVEESGR